MNRIKSVMLLTLLSVILMAIGGMVGGRSGAMVMFIISLGINFISYWNCDKIALHSYNAQPLSREEVPELYELVEELTKRRICRCPGCMWCPRQCPMHLQPAVMKIMQQLL